jgi:DNA-binding NarL/FixJ family response regulator
MRRKSPDVDAIPIAVVEDNRLLREGIVAILKRHPDFEVVAVEEDAESALLRVPESGARMVLVDAGLGDRDSQDLVGDIASAFPEMRVVVMDILPEPREVVEFVKRGASGFVVKEASIETFLETIRAVAEGREVLPPTLTSTLFTHIVEQATTRRSQTTDRSVRMTSREHQVIELIAQGMSNKQIARELRISAHTVKSHVRNILEKLALHSRLQVAAYVHQAGPLLEGEPE